MFFKSKFKKIEFDKDLWLNNREQRAYMIASIINNNLINGLTKKEVIDILGFEFNDKNTKIWTYYVGKQNRLFSCKRYLYVYFDGFDRVFKVFKK